MTEAMFQRVLERAEAQAAKKGPAKLPDERTITLYVASHGASMTVGNVVELSLVEGVIEAKNKKGELFLLAVEDVFGASITIEGERATGRKAGFIG